MRPFIIVTIRDFNNKINYDMELPTDVPVSKLCEDIDEVLTAYNLLKTPSVLSGKLYCERLGRKNLPDDKTLSEIGVWSGDVLFII